MRLVVIIRNTTILTVCIKEICTIFVPEALINYLKLSCWKKNSTHNFFIFVKIRYFSLLKNIKTKFVYKIQTKTQRYRQGMKMNLDDCTFLFLAPLRAQPFCRWTVKWCSVVDCKCSFFMFLYLKYIDKQK